MTLPTPDARAARSLPQNPRQAISPTHSISDTSYSPPPAPQAAITPSSTSSSSRVHTGLSNAEHEHALNFATHSWDLATGGLKTLTAKRVLPRRADRRSSGTAPELVVASRSYLIALVLLACVVLMLVGGGIVLFVMLLS